VRFADAALIDPQAHDIARKDLGKSDIDTLRRARMALDQRAEPHDRGVLNRVHD
jgi:hypothetical protein